MRCIPLALVCGNPIKKAIFSALLLARTITQAAAASETYEINPENSSDWRERGSKKNAADFVIPPVQFAAICTPSSPIERLSSLPICRMAMRKKGKKVQADYDNFSLRL